MNEVDLFMKSDIFSYGLVLYYMITGIKPWAEQESHAAGFVRVDQQSYDNSVVPDTPKSLGKGPLSDLYHSCLHRDPDKRLTATEIINKKFQGTGSIRDKIRPRSHDPGSLKTVHNFNSITLFSLSEHSVNTLC